jgi:hypothetical protein
MTTQNWLKDRQKLFITGSDCIFAIKEFCPEFMSKGSEYLFNTYNKTKFQFYYEKTMPLDKLMQMNEIPYNQQDKDKKAIMKEGKDREEEIGKRIAEERGIKLTANGENLCVNEKFNIGATPDFYIETENEERMILECKLLNPISNYVCEEYCYDNGLNFEQEDLESIKEKIKLERQLKHQFQVNLQLYCTGLKEAILATANKKYDTIGSEITHIDYVPIIENKKCQNYIIEASKRVKQWFEDIKNGIIEKPQPDLTNAKDCLICDLLELNEQASIRWKTYRLFQLEEAQKEYDKTKDSLKYVLNVKFANENYKETIDIDGITLDISRNVYEDKLWDEESLDKEIEKTKIKLKELENTQIGSLKTKGSTRLIVKEAFNNQN